MPAQGSELINTGYLETAAHRIAAAHSCADLQRLAGEIVPALASVEAGISAQLAVLQPIVALLDGPSASPDKIVTWLTSFIEHVLTPHVAPVAKFTAQLAQLQAKRAELVASIAAKAAEIGSCAVTIPGVPGG